MVCSTLMPCPSLSITAWRTARKHKSRSGYGRVAPHVRPKAATVPRRGRCRMLRVLNGKVHACLCEVVLTAVPDSAPHDRLSRLETWLLPTLPLSVLEQLCKDAITKCAPSTRSPLHTFAPTC